MDGKTRNELDSTLKKVEKLARVDGYGKAFVDFMMGIEHYSSAEKQALTGFVELRRKQRVRDGQF